MDIVQYLHGLVSDSMGISNEDTSADLLKQYYALSVARLIELGDSFDMANPKNHQLNALWGELVPALTQRLTRSFHMDEGQTATLLRVITPPMMAEITNIAGGQQLIEFLAQNFTSSHMHLPAWSSEFLQESFLQKIEAFLPPKTSTTPSKSNNENPNANQDDTSDSLQDTHAEGLDADHKLSDDIVSTTTHKPKPKKANTAFIALGVGLLALLAGGGIWYALSRDATQDEPPITYDASVARPDVESLNPPRLSITSGENGTLYACQAEVGNAKLQEELLGILQKNFGELGCIMDIDDNFGTSLTGLERLDSIIAMVKSEPFTHIEIVGSHIYVNTPKTDILPRLTDDIALLAPQFQVSPAPALDKASVINQSLANATTALNQLGNPPNDYDLSRAASLAVIDFNGTQEIPEHTQATLSLIAQKIAQKPTAKFIIVTHTSGGEGSDRLANLTLSQNQAEAVKAFLVKHGVGETQLIAKGVGDAFPVADNLTELGKFKNNRTEFLVFDENILSALHVDMTQMMPANTAQNTAPQIPAQAMPQQAPSTQMAQPYQAQHPTQYPAYPAQSMPTQSMPVQGMPDGNYLPHSVEAVAPATAPSSYGYIGTTPPPAPSVPTTPDLPDDFIELSNANINSEHGKNTDREVR